MWNRHIISECMLMLAYLLKLSKSVRACRNYCLQKLARFYWDSVSCSAQCRVNTFHIRPLVAVTAVPVFIYVCASESTELWRYINLSIIIIIIYYIGYNHYQLIHLCLFSSYDKLAATFPFIHVFCPEDSSQSSCFSSFSSRFSEGTRLMLADEVERGSVLIVRQLMTSYCASHS